MKPIFAACVACAVVLSASSLFAEEEKEKESTGEAAPAAEAKAGEETGAKAPAKNPFHQLIRLARVDAGRIEAKRPRETEWIVCEEGRFYPNGSEFRAVVLDPENDRSPAPRATFEFGPGCLMLVSNVCSFATREVAIGAKTRTVLPKSGAFRFALPRTLPVDSLHVIAPHFALKDLAGESIIDYRPMDDGDSCDINVITGQMVVEGPHFRIAKMAAANQVSIRSLADGLFTSLRCVAGTYVVRLDQGTLMVRNFTDGTSKEEDKTLDFELSPKCAVKIFRTRSRAAGRMVADVMTFAASGEMQNHCSFAEKRYNVNTGELILKPGQAEAIKAAAEAALEATKADAEKEESSNKNEKKEEE